MNKNKKRLTVILSLFILSTQIIGCSQNNNNDNNSSVNANDLIGKTKVYSVSETQKIESTDEISLINKLTNAKQLKTLYKQKIVYENADLIKIVINKIAEDEQLTNNSYAYLDIQIHPKLDILYNDVKLVENNEGKQDIFGEIIIKNNNLEEYEKEYFKYYNDKYPEKVEYKDNIIKIKFNK